jgi:NAD(P)-dependent dehydrogenase (short-subunit alcohol dehydrogenase family)
MATAFIMGASRGIGLETVKCALAANHNVRAPTASARAGRWMAIREVAYPACFLAAPSLSSG